MQENPTFFDFAAEVGLTKHIGGIVATDELAELCCISEGKSVLDVGCGAGQTPCYLARKYHCRVVGIDILDRMVERSQERTAKEKLLDWVSFRVADAQSLPFEDHYFDAVITESVTAFPEDKQKAVNEYARVTKPGGYVGLNESTWLKYPPPPEMLAWASQDLGANVSPLTISEWTGLLEHAGLTEIVIKTKKINVQEESKGLVQRYGCSGTVGIWIRMLSLFIKSRAYRHFVKEVQQGGITPRNLEEYFGYGLYVGHKI